MDNLLTLIEIVALLAVNSKRRGDYKAVSKAARENINPRTGLAYTPPGILVIAARAQHKLTRAVRGHDRAGLAALLHQALPADASPALRKAG